MSERPSKPSSDGDGESDTAFEALLKAAANVSLSATLPSSSTRPSLYPGSRLARGRLEVLERVGAGGMGVVYRAHDSVRSETIALKTLSHVDASGIYRLKNEFRALAGVPHPNLVRLHELFVEESAWYFTMDLVEGERFDRWVRPAGELDETRLRYALPQLASGIAAIHAAGKLHRDIKPNNVLVEADGRVVVLDFGLVADRDVGGVGHTVDEMFISGTPWYMAPEQAAGLAACEASDLYAVGVMLFEALTDRLPFVGSSYEVMCAKQQSAAPRVSEVVPSVSSDLDTLCAALLSREPRARPSAIDLGAAFSAAVFTPAEDEAAADRILGRDTELARLHEAYRASVAGTPTVMLVSGESGMGKSSLVDAFLRDLKRGGRAAVLSGRCYERESVPFKGLDAVMDDLSRFLHRQDAVAAASLMPRNVFALVRLFPVLDRVKAVAQAPQREIPDPVELRRRAFAAFGEMLSRIRDRHPLVVYIDDAQWLDGDGAAFLRTMLVHREPTPLLFVLSYRSECIASNATLQTIVRVARDNPMLATHDLLVQPLAPSAAEALATRCLGASHSALVQRTAQEAAGSPFFVAELARYAKRRNAQSPMTISLTAALADRLQSQAEGARRLLEVLALAGRPLPRQVALQAAGTSYQALDSLSGTQLIRLSGGEACDAVECYHDRIREAVLARIDEADSVARYGELFAALAPHADVDPELLMRCLEGAGRHSEAALHAERAGDQAAAATAFDHAAGLYENALVLGKSDTAARLMLELKRGDALAHAGEGRRAAAVYRDAAKRAPAQQALDLRRKAAEQLLQCGHIQEGELLLREVCSEVGVRIPSSSGAAIRSLVWSQVRQRFARLTPVKPDLNRAAPLASRRLEFLRTVVYGLVAHDPVVASSMGYPYLVEALRCRDPEHLVYAAGGLAYLHSLSQPTDHVGTERLLAIMRAAIGEHSSAFVRALQVTFEGQIAAHRGQWQQGLASISAGRKQMETGCIGASWHVDTLRIYEQFLMFCTGELRQIARTTPALREEAFRRGRIWIGSTLGTVYGVAGLLCGGEVDGARAMLAEGRARWQPPSPVLWTDILFEFGDLLLAAYTGELFAAHATSMANAPAFQRSLVRHTVFTRVLYVSLRGGVALSLSRHDPKQRDARSLARECARGLRDEPVPHALHHSRALDAGLALAEGQHERAAEALRAAERGFVAQHMTAYAAAARRRLGQLVGGDEGKKLIAEGDAPLLAQGATDLDALTEMLVPGCRSQ